MKFFKTVFKIVAVLMAIGAIACVAFVYWDKIEQAFFCVKKKIADMKLRCTECCDFADMEE